jgi:hypothetical protein
MTRSIFLLAVLCATLAGVIVMQLRPGGTDETPAQALAIGRPPAPSQATDSSTDHDLWIVTAQARPLFAASRRPASQPVDEAPATPLSLPRLTAVLSGPFGQRAIFAGPAGDKPLVVSVGDSVGIYRVLRIENGEVTLNGAGETRQLRPSFADAAPPPTSPPAMFVPSGLPPGFLQENVQPSPQQGQQRQRRR